jgi:NADH:ubiquinone oxidoreductase subunit 6 (subunit J)
VEAIERRAAWVAISLAITVAFASTGGFAYAFGGLGTWELVAYVGALACLPAAGVLLVAALSPDSIRSFSLEERTRLVYLAFVLLVIAIVLIVGLSAHGAIEAHRHPQR